MPKNTSVPKPLILSGIRDNHTRGRAALLAVPISGNHSEIHPTLGDRSNGNARTWAEVPGSGSNHDGQFQGILGSSL